ncbi:MAG: family 20 glycosylhydrolase [Phycisphaerales bacterium]
MNPVLADLPPLLLPSPARLVRTPGWVTLRPETVAWINCRDPFNHADQLPAQVSCRVTGGWCGATSVDAHSYRIRTGAPASPAGLEVEAPSAVGVRYARATLRQLLVQYANPDAPRLPMLDITDAPAFPTRGVMLDVSRCRIPTMAEFARVIDTLCDLKCNHLQLYTEHTFAYRGHEAAWSGWDPLTPDEVRTLDALCSSRGIELAANQNCFGHLAQWLKLPQYKHLAETHGDWVFDVWPRSGPFSLCPTDPASLGFVEELLDQLLPCFTSTLVNIGCDETYDIAYGRSKGEVARRGRAAVFLEFVEKICALSRAHGKRPMFWGDIALSHPECAKSIPEDTISLAWGYEPDAPFAAWCDTLRSAGREAWVCPGTSSWCSIAGRTTERKANVERAAREGAAGGATGLLACDWGDFGHWQQWPVAVRGIADGLAAAWTGALPDHRAVALHALADTTLTAAHWLDELGDADLPLRETCLGLSRPGHAGRLRNQSACFADMRIPLGEPSDVGPGPLWNAAMERTLELSARVPTTTEPLVNQELKHTAALTLALASRAVLRRMDTPPRHLHAAWFRDCVLSHRHLWQERCREGGLAQSCVFFDRIIQELEAAP